LAALVSGALMAGMLMGVGQSPAAADTVGVPSLLKDIGAGALSSDPGWFVEKDGEVFFVTHNTFANPDNAVTSGLWKTDGTEAGTQLVKALNTGQLIVGGSTPSAQLTLVGDTLYFAAASGGSTGSGADLELWKSDGTEAGTVLLKDIQPGTTAGGDPRTFTAVGSTVFFTAATSTEGRELWKTDGTEAGTVMVKDIFSGAGSSNPGLVSSVTTNFAVLGDTLLFPASNGTTAGTGNGIELWKSDGTEAGTVLVKDINTDCPGATTALSSNPHDLTVVGNKVLFGANSARVCGLGNGSGDGDELWETDGTEAGTVMLKDINPTIAVNGNGNGSAPSSLKSFGSVVLFAANNGTTGAELWKTDGTAAGTVLVKDINPGSGNSNPRRFTEAGGVAYFSAINGTATGFNGAELWKTDGTAAGTVLVKDIRPGTASSTPGGQTGSYNMLALGADVYFGADDGAHGIELWRSDGTEAGTVLAGDINPGTASSNPSVMAIGLGKLFFNATNSTTGIEPWVLAAAGSPNASPVAVDDIYPTDEDTPLTVSAPGVLGNDTDSDGDTLSAGSAGDPANGSVTLNADGSFTYTPDANFNGTDTFAYEVSDGQGGTDTGLVTITVNSLNDGPEAIDDAYTTKEDTTLNVSAPGVLGNDTDPDGGTLTAGSPSTPDNGTVTLNPDGSFTYTPDAGFVGTDSFTYTASDGSLDSNMANVTITVTRRATVADFTGDGKTDVSVYRSSDGLWFVEGGDTTHWGTEGDIAVPGDYDGDGDIDIAVYRPSLGIWLVNGGDAVAWGAEGDIPVPGDYDGDGDTDMAVFRPSSGIWFVEGAATVHWGTEGDIPVPGDYDGDGTTDMAVFRPALGLWLFHAGDGMAWGTEGDIPVPGDYDGDGTTDIAVFRPSSGLWFVEGGETTPFGTDGDTPLPLPHAIGSFF
jgi:ELWxxDGT repeat protein